MAIDADQNPKTYRNFTTEDVDYYLHVFGDAAKEGTSPSFHCTRCAELVAMLQDLKRLKKKEPLKKYTFQYAEWANATVTVKARSMGDAMEKARATLDARYEKLGKEPPVGWTLTQVNR